ncbi:MAG: DsrE family protein [Moraxellaceae bacterium]
MYDVERLYADADSLAARGLAPARLALPVTVLDAEGLRALLAEHDRILRF